MISIMFDFVKAHKIEPVLECGKIVILGYSIRCWRIKLFYRWIRQWGGVNKWVALQQASMQCFQWCDHSTVGPWCDSMHERSCVYPVWHYNVSYTLPVFILHTSLYSNSLVLNSPCLTDSPFDPSERTLYSTPPDSSSTSYVELI